MLGTFSMQPQNHKGSLGACLGAIFIGGILGLPFAIGSIYGFLWAFDTRIRFCPHGWCTIAIGTIFIIGGFYYGKTKDRLLGGLLAGVGISMGAVGGFAILFCLAISSC